jgi:vacuolar-type H+-ATPase subunit C/Vma6
MPYWADLVARTRGLGTHLIPEARWHALADAADLRALAQGLRDAGIDLGEEPETAASFELSVRRWAAASLAILMRWSGARTVVLAVVFEDEDRRSLRAILRGAAQGVAAEQRMAGLLPTPALPEKALLELARLPTVAAVASLLSAWRHPYGPALSVEARSPHPDLLRLEITLAKTFAERALRSARSDGAGVLLGYARQVLDLDNVMTALVLAGPDRSVTPKDVFLPGGSRVTIAVYERAIATGLVADAAETLAAAFAGTPLAPALRGAAADPGMVERSVLGAQLRMLAAQARTDPLGPAHVIGYALRLRAQVMDLRRIIWGTALGAPADARLAARGVA